MPLGAPIGTNQGLSSKTFLEIIIDQANVPVIVDAGIGAPSDAALAMEMGADAVLVNTAIATARDPIAWRVPSSSRWKRGDWLMNLAWRRNANTLPHRVRSLHFWMVNDELCTTIQPT